MKTRTDILKGEAKMTPEKVIYLSGPMSGYPQANYPAFYTAAQKLRAEGHRVYNPAEFPHNGTPDTFPLRMAFASYCNFICLEADTICLLDGWEKSLGVSAELALAKNCKLNVMKLSADGMRWVAIENP
jgi:hypothetical protein